MIPRNDDVIIEVRQFDHAVGLPDAEAVWDEAGFGAYHETFCLAGSTLESARELIAIERELLDEADERSADEIEFDVRVDCLERGVDAPDDAPPLWGLDLGVAGLVVVLNALGMPTSVSCRGHPAGWSTHPVVQFAADEHRAPLLVDLVRRSRCGVGPGEAFLEIWAESPVDTHAFAEMLLGHAADFARLPIPAHIAARPPSD